MQTMAITQRKNIQYLSSGYPVTFIPFDALSSLSGKERREFEFVASSHVVLPPTVTANAMNPQLLTSTHRQSVHWLSSLTFLLYESFYQRAVCLIIQSFQLHSPWSGVKWRIAEHFTKVFFICEVFKWVLFFFIVLRSSCTEWVSMGLQELVDQNISYGLDNLFNYFILPAELAWSWVSIYMIWY